MSDFMNLDIFEESEISGKAPTVSAPPVSKHQGPTSSKLEITADQYNAALTNLKKSFNESIDLLAQCTIIESKPQSLEEKMNEVYENAIIEAYLEAADNGPIYESVEKEGKKSIRSTITKLRKELSEKLDKDYNFVGGKTSLRNIEIGLAQAMKTVAKGYTFSLFAGLSAGAVVGAMAGTEAGKEIGKAVQGIGKDATKASVKWNTAGFTLKKLFDKYTWQTVGSICIPKDKATTMLNNIKSIISDNLEEGSNEKLYLIKVNKTITESLISKFKYKVNNGQLYLLIIDNDPPKEIQILSKPLKKVKIEDKKEDSKEDKKDDKKEDKNVNESYELVFDESSEDDDIDGDI